MADYIPYVTHYDINTPLWTWRDLVEWLLDFYNRETDSGRDLRMAKRAAEQAYRDLPKYCDWKYYQRRYMLTTTADYSTGTIAYDHTEGTYERMVTLTTGTWPSDAAYGVLVIDDVHYDVDTRESDSVITLRPDSNPGADVAASTSYDWYRDSYPLPPDFRRMGMMLDTDLGACVNGLAYGDLEQLYTYNRGANWQVNEHPWMYAIARDDRRGGGLNIYFSWPPDSARTYEFPYHGFGRPLRVYYEDTGTIAVSGSTVTGTGTAFSSSHIGCVLRVSGNSLAPTSIFGSPFPSGQDDGDDNPAVLERIVKSVSGATTLTIDTASATAYSGKGYSLSSWLDVDSYTMIDALKQLAALEFCKLSNDTTADAMSLARLRWQNAINLAMDGERKTTSPMTGMHTAYAAGGFYIGTISTS